MNEEEYKELITKMYNDIQKEQGYYGITSDDMRDVGVRSGLFDIVKKPTMSDGDIAFHNKYKSHPAFKNTQDKYRELMDQRKIREKYLKNEYIKEKIKGAFEWLKMICKKLMFKKSSK